MAALTSGEDADVEHHLPHVDVARWARRRAGPDWSRDDPLGKRGREVQ